MNWKVKRILDDIIDVAYKEESEQKRKFYKWFTIELEVKENSSYHGIYYQNKKLIRIVNLSNGTEEIVKTCIHELAHHIDYCMHKKTGHQEPFYNEYRVLLYTALNMRILNKEHLFDNHISQDYNKVRKIVNAWVPDYIDYKHGKILIKVTVPFEKKEDIKQRGYHWNNIEKFWEKEIKSTEEDSERFVLLSMGGKFKTNDACALTIDAVGYLVTMGDSYNWKDILKENGFKYSNKKWYKKIDAKKFSNEKKSIMLLTPGLDYKLVDKIK